MPLIESRQLNPRGLSDTVKKSVNETASSGEHSEVTRTRQLTEKVRQVRKGR
jgi:hypothetical protein